MAAALYFGILAFFLVGSLWPVLYSHRANDKDYEAKIAKFCSLGFSLMVILSFWVALIYGLVQLWIHRAPLS